VAEQDDARDGEVAGEGVEVVGGALEGVVGEGRGCGGEPVAHHVRGDDAQVEGQQEGDLGAPAEGEVGPAVDEEDGCNGGGGAGVQVVVADAVEVGVFVGDAGVGRGEFVDWGRHCEGVSRGGVGKLAAGEEVEEL